MNGQHPDKNSCTNMCVSQCVCSFLQMFLGNKPPVRGKVHENIPICLPLSLFAFSVSATCWSPLAPPVRTAHHLFLETLVSSYIWHSSGALHGRRKWLLMFAQLARFLRGVDSLQELLNFTCFFFFYNHLFPSQGRVQAAHGEKV